MIYLIPIALLCALNSAIGTDLQCENGNCTYSDEATTDLSKILGEIDNKTNIGNPITSLTIDTSKSTTLTGDKQTLGSHTYYNNGKDFDVNYGFNVTAGTLEMKGDTGAISQNDYSSKISVTRPSSRINANLIVDNTHIEVLKFAPQGYDGSLTINGNFTATNSNIQQGVDSATFIVNGKSDIKTTKFIVYSVSALSNTASKVLMLTSNGGFNSDILADTAGNKAVFRIRKDTTILEKTYNFKFLDENSTEIGAPIGNGDGIDDEVFNVVLRKEGNNLYVAKEIGNKSLKDLALKNIEMDLKVVKEEIQRIDSGKSSLSKTEQTKFKGLQKVIETKQEATQNQTDEEIAESYNRQNGSQYGSVTLSAITSADKDLVGATIASDLFFNNGDGAVKETIDSSTQIADDGGQSQSVTAQNMQSEMATTTRMAKFSNPYAKVYYAQNTMTTQRALNGDIRSDVPLTPYFTTNELLNNLWANLFGGANIIGGNVGEIYGLNAGYDRRIGAHFLGGYVSYAYATMKDSHINQTTHNIQAGLYSRLVFGKNEIDIKWSAQAGITKQNRYVVNLSNDAHFTRAFMGLNGSYGYVFKMGKGVFLKPMLGVNFYFSYTPKYSEKGDLAQTIQAMSSTNLSVDIGADLRAYWNEDSFFYIVPKFEQYVLTQNDDFVGAFVGSPNNFRITAQNKLKTYFQGIVGVDIGVYQGLAITLNGGVKQIISEHIDSRNETFISGNLGVKYRF